MAGVPFLGLAHIKKHRRPAGSSDLFGRLICADFRHLGHRRCARSHRLGEDDGDAGAYRRVVGAHDVRHVSEAEALEDPDCG